MFSRRGYSLVMWTAVFAVVTAATAMFIGSVRRTIIAKTLNTTDYVMWSMWGDDVQEDGNWNHQQKGSARGSVKHDVDFKALEHEGKNRAIIDVKAKTNSTSQSWQ